MTDIGENTKVLRPRIFRIIWYTKSAPYTIISSIAKALIPPIEIKNIGVHKILGGGC